MPTKFLRILLGGAAFVALTGGLGLFRAQADSWDKRTVLTINEPMQVRDKLLEPGTYVFKLLNSNSDRHIVQIFNEDQTHVIDTVLAIPNYRLEPTGNSRFGFWETPPGYAKALRAWFYPGDNFGQEFPYPKHLAAVETASVSVTKEPLRPPEPPPQPEPVAKPQPAPEPAPQQEIARAEAPPSPSPAPAPAEPPAQAPAPAQPAAAPDQTLPKTASNYPALGLVGLGCLALFGAVRGNGLQKRS
jgi:outer membrane biosynthesis protein TonB